MAIKKSYLVPSSPTKSEVRSSSKKYLGIYAYICKKKSYQKINYHSLTTQFIFHLIANSRVRRCIYSSCFKGKGKGRRKKKEENSPVKFNINFYSSWKSIINITISLFLLFLLLYRSETDEGEARKRSKCVMRWRSNGRRRCNGGRGNCLWR